MPIDYSRFLGQSWTIFSRNRVLWGLGFVMALGASAIAPIALLANLAPLPVIREAFSTNTLESPETLWARVLTESWARWGGLALIGGVVLLGLLLATGFVSAGGEAALITAVDEIERTGQAPRFGPAWQQGRRRWGSLWLLSLVVGVVTLGLTALAFAPLLFGLITFVNELSRNPNSAAPGSGFAWSMACSGLLFLPVLVITIVLTFVRQLAAQAVVLDGAGVRAALGTGWQVLRQNVGPALVIVVVTYVAGYVSGFIVGPISAVVILPIFAVGLLQMGDPSWSGLFILLLIIGSLAYWLLLGAVSGTIAAFTTTLWTRLYRYQRGLPNSNLAPPPSAPYGSVPTDSAPTSSAPYSVIPGSRPNTAPPPYPLMPPSPPAYTPPPESGRQP